MVSYKNVFCHVPIDHWSVADAEVLFRRSTRYGSIAASTKHQPPTSQLHLEHQHSPYLQHAVRSLRYRVLGAVHAEVARALSKVFNL